MDQLFYSPASSSLTLVQDNNNYTSWNGVSNLVVSASEYNTTGSDFGVTMGSLRILAYSGSILLASFPIETTALYYPPFPDTTVGLSNILFDTPPPPITSVNYSYLPWEFNISPNTPVNLLSGSWCTVYNNTNSTYYVSESLASNGGELPLISGDNYTLTLYGSGSYTSSLILNDTTSGSIIFSGSSINAPISASFIPLTFHNYEVTFSLSSSSQPAIISWSLDEYYETGSVLLDANFSIQTVGGGTVFVNQSEIGTGSTTIASGTTIELYSYSFTSDGDGSYWGPYLSAVLSGSIVSGSTEITSSSTTIVKDYGLVEIYTSPITLVGGNTYYVYVKTSDPDVSSPL